MKLTIQYRHSMGGSTRTKTLQGPAVSVATMDEYTVIKAGEVGPDGRSVGTVNQALYVRTINVLDIWAESTEESK